MAWCECERETRVADASSEAISNSRTALCRCAAFHAFHCAGAPHRRKASFWHRLEDALYPLGGGVFL